MSGTQVTARPPAFSTRVLMVCAALAAVQVVLFVAMSAVTPSLAATLPPAYAVVAGVHSVMPFLARRLTGVTGSATVTALIAGVLVFSFSVLGPLAIVPLLTAGLAFDLALLPATRRARRARAGSRQSGIDGAGHDEAGTREPRRPGEWAFVLAAVAAAILLFLVSLPVFSAEHLTPLMLIGTFVGRVIGEVGATLVAGLLARALVRAGVARS